MKKTWFQKRAEPPKPSTGDADDLKSPITATEYLALPASTRTAYRPVNPKYERLPVACICLYALAAVCLILYFVMQYSVGFADWFNQTVSAPLRILFAALTSWLPFSLGELAILLIPLGLFLVLRHAVRERTVTWRTTLVYVGILLSVVATIFSVFVLNFAAGYRGSTLDQKLELQREDVSAEDLYQTAVILAEQVNREREEIVYATDGFSVMPYNLNDMNGHLSDAYASFSADHGFVTHVPSRVKPVMLSEVMSYLHITGVYSFFTGEANINVNFPDYTIPYTAAHELAHQRGIAREDEANFVAFLVCTESDDPYIRYSGYLNLYEYVANALYSADKDLYNKASAKLDKAVWGEMRAYSKFYEKYRDSAVSNVSSAVNDSYLQSQGTPGTRSYGMVVDLAVAYYKTTP